MWPIRSALFVPAHRRDWVGKALRVKPHAVILDIEDSVPPQFKPQAMEYLKSEIAELKAAKVGAFVRVNPLHGRTGEELAAAIFDQVDVSVRSDTRTEAKLKPQRRRRGCARSSPAPHWTVAA